MYPASMNLKVMKIIWIALVRGKVWQFSTKENFEKSDHKKESINITKIESADTDVIAIYRSQEGSVGSLIQKLKDIINISKSTLIIGDMNICNKKMKQNDLRKFLEEHKFNQIINRASHINGGHINHAYVLNIGNFEEVPTVELVPKYYSDHDAICIAWKKVSPKDYEP